MDDRAGELDALPLAGRHRPDGPEPLLAEPDLPECIVGPLDRGTPRQAVELAQMANEIGCMHVGRQVVMLRCEADARPDVDARCRGIVAEDGQLAGIARSQAEHEGDEGRLAGTVRPEQAGDAVPDVDVEPVDGELRPVALRDAARADDRQHARRCRSSPHSLAAARHPGHLRIRSTPEGFPNRSVPSRRTLLMQTGTFESRTEVALAVVALFGRAAHIPDLAPRHGDCGSRADWARRPPPGTTAAARNLSSVATAGSALVHFAVAPEHFAEWWGFGLFFVLCAEVQLGWAILLGRIRSNRMLAIGIAGSLALVAVWALSRTTGLPFGPEPGVPEEIGLPDLVSVVLELITVAACAWALLVPNRIAVRASLPLRALGLALTIALTAWALAAVAAA